jgi:hypothetical protein
LRQGGCTGAVGGAHQALFLHAGQAEATGDLRGQGHIGGDQRGQMADGDGGDALRLLLRDQSGQRRHIGLGQDFGQHAKRLHPRHGGGGIGQGEEVHRLHADAFARQALQGCGQIGAGLLGLGIGVSGTEAGAEAEVAQDAQMVLADALMRIADKADAAILQILQAAEIVEDLQRFGIGIERVDGEIAPRRILAPVLSEGHRRPAPVGGNVMAQRGDLHRAAGQHHGHRAMLDAGGHGFEAGFLAGRDHILGA